MALVLVLGAGVTYRFLRPGDRGIQSIAVLPFANQGGNPDNEYLSDGITESVIGSLSHLPKLKMIAFGSVLRYKGRPVDAAMRQQNQLILDSLKASAEKDYVSPGLFALSYAKLGNLDQAFAWLDKAFAERTPWLTYIKTDPAFDSLHSDPRFADLLRRVGLPR